MALQMGKWGYNPAFRSYNSTYNWWGDPPCILIVIGITFSEGLYLNNPFICDSIHILLNPAISQVSTWWVSTPNRHLIWICQCNQSARQRRRLTTDSKENMEKTLENDISTSGKLVVWVGGLRFEPGATK